MFIAKQKKKENIAEYIIYMWQIEDLIRANNLDIELIKENVINKFDIPQQDKKEMTEWYESLIDMMRYENVVEKGHLQINKNSIIDLTDTHLRLLQSPREAEYKAIYYKTLPFIVELRTKNEDKSIPELETCISALYGYLLLKLQQKEISGETQAAIAQISSLLRNLSVKYKQEKESEAEIQ